MFAGVSQIFTSLGAAAETVGNALNASLSELARKAEVLMSVLWEININASYTTASNWWSGALRWK
ncbi:hypothetical protein M407DRAFT_240841 [Tulasnella calospora MUT 4182]|uniref:Uncharacterized protein n=1 Tax=Tulasnella calospora MUT 4182 TaxID=1051891 RepID=A0A0C3QM42_9AGAM|nr:hypothetical protein M407DRAFT_240841 [Tulasnella calospora MUT 4182]